MQQTMYRPLIFSLEYKGNSYPCLAFDKPGGALYRIDFGKSCLFLTRAKAPNGTVFWTSIPEDTKINHIVQALGVLIENHFK
jgi:hypothetical protein